VKDETRKLLKEREENKNSINLLRSKNRDLTNKMCGIEGHCPHCSNWHYPHCGMD